MDLTKDLTEYRLAAAAWLIEKAIEEATDIHLLDCPAREDHADESECTCGLSAILPSHDQAHELGLTLNYETGKVTRG